MLRFVVGLLLPKPCRNFVQKKKRKFKEKIVALICVSYDFRQLPVNVSECKPWVPLFSLFHYYDYISSYSWERPTWSSPSQ